MRSIILAVVAIVALSVAGLGGTLAGFSDSEISQDNYIVTGALDLKVNGEDDPPWGEGVGPKVELDHMTPCVWYHYYIDVRNDGQCDNEPDLYIHFKNFKCSNVEPDHGGIVAGEGRPGFPVEPPDYGVKPEPELVAEYGGLVDQRWVDGIGLSGDKCTLGSHIEVTVYYGPIEGTIVEVIPPTKMEDLNCEQLYLGKLPPCSEVYLVTLAFHLQQIGPDTTPWPTKDNPDVLKPVPEKFQWWKTNALQKDKIMFDIEFDLIQQEEEV